MINKLTSSNFLKPLLYIYIFSILFFDYTIVFKIISLFMLVGVLLFIAHGKKIKITTLFISYGIFSMYFIIHTLTGFSKDFSLSLDYCLTLILNSVIIFSMSNIIEKQEDIINMIKMFIFSSLFCTTYVFLFNLFSNNVFTTEVNYLIFSNIKFSHNDIPIMAGFSVCFIFYLFKKNESKYKKYLWLCLPFSLVIILSGARKSFILLALALVTYYLFGKKNKIAYKLIFKFIFVIILCLMGVFLLLNVKFLYNNIGFRFESFINGIIGGSFGDSSSFSRSIMLETAINLIKEKPFNGYGLFAFSTFPGSYGTWCHNNYLEIIVSGGVGMLFVFYYPYIKYLFTLTKSKNYNEKILYIFLILFIILIYDNLSVSFFSRLLLIIVVFIDSYCFLLKKGKK